MCPNRPRLGQPAPEQHGKQNCQKWAADHPPTPRAPFLNYKSNPENSWDTQDPGSEPGITQGVTRGSKGGRLEAFPDSLQDNQDHLGERKHLHRSKPKMLVAKILRWQHPGTRFPPNPLPTSCTAKQSQQQHTNHSPRRGKQTHSSSNSSSLQGRQNQGGDSE